MTAFRGVCLTDPGRVRTSNQDLGLVSDELVAVADGMGGHVGGEVAARVAIDALRKGFASDPTASGLLAAVAVANRAVHEQSERDADLKGMGTTLTTAALARAGRRLRLVVANVGDSRAYLLDNRRLVQLTDDHSLVEEMVRNGELTPAEAAVHPHRHILTRALGVDQGVQVDSWQLDPRPGSRLLLCSDGLTNECSDEVISEILASSPDPESAARNLVRAALEHGGSDNVTVVVVDVDASVDPEPRAGSPASVLSGSDRSATSVAGRGTRGLPASDRRQAHQANARPAERDRRRDRVLSIRSVLFVVVFVGLLGGAAGVVGWYVKSSYFVGIDHGYVAVFEGRPGGFLWFAPEVVDRTALPVSKVFAPNLPPLRAGMLEPSFATAESVAGALESEHRDLALPSVDTVNALGVVGTTTTTIAPATTTAPKKTRSTTSTGPSGHHAAGSTTATSRPATTTTTSRPATTTATTTTTLPSVATVPTAATLPPTPTST